MKQTGNQQDTIEAERMRRLSKIWQQAKPSSFEIGVAEKRIAARGRERGFRWVGFALAATVGLLLLLAVPRAERPSTAIAPAEDEDVSAPPASETQAGSPDGKPAQLELASRDATRLAAAEALHRSGQCRAAKPELEDLALRGATQEVRIRAQKLLEEISVLPPQGGASVAPGTRRTDVEKSR